MSPQIWWLNWATHLTPSFPAAAETRQLRGIQSRHKIRAAALASECEPQGSGHTGRRAILTIITTIHAASAALDALSMISHGHRHQSYFHFTDKETEAHQGRKWCSQDEDMNPEFKPLTRKPSCFCFVHAEPPLPPHPVDREPLPFPAKVSSFSILKSSIRDISHRLTRLFVRSHDLLVSPLQTACLDSHLPSSGDAAYLPPRPHVDSQHILLATSPPPHASTPCSSQSSSLCCPSAMHVPDSSTNTQRLHIPHQSAEPSLRVTGREWPLGQWPLKCKPSTPKPLL